MTFEGHVSDAELTIASAGFSTEMWEPEFGWTPLEKEAGEAPHPPQMLAALMCFVAFFIKPVQRVWTHLGAEMQAGKTGVINALTRLILKNARKLKFTPGRIFVLTGMNDNAWKKQTRERLPCALHANVFHNGGLVNFAKAIASLAAGQELSNVLIVIDESHLASAIKNRPSKHIYEMVTRLCPQEKWQENTIRFLTISATDPAKVLTIAGIDNAQVVRLQTTSEYQSIESLNAAKRIRSLETFKNINDPSAIAELKRCIAEEFSDAPRYHIIRAPYGKTGEVIEKISEAFPHSPVVKFDAVENARRSSVDDDVRSDCSMDDINDVLLEAPDKDTFVVIKNMLYAAKTLNDEFVGVLWDRLSSGGKDDTSLQSLVGRACGYNKNKRTIIYTSKTTVDNYLSFWRELCADERMKSLVITDANKEKLAKRMVGIDAHDAVGGGVQFSVNSNVSCPLYAAGGDAEPPVVPVKRQKAVESNFEHSYVEYSSFEAAKTAVEGIHTPKYSDDGFYLTSTSGSIKKQPYSAVLAACTGKKTANLPWGNLEVGGKCNRLYVGYKDANDVGSAVFVVRTLTRIG